MKLYYLLLTHSLVGRKTTQLTAAELNDLWRLQLAGYVHVINTKIYATRD
jgi:hypothetical protein